MVLVLYEEVLGVTLAGRLFHMCKSGQFYPNLTWGHSAEVCWYVC